MDSQNLTSILPGVLASIVAAGVIKLFAYLGKQIRSKRVKDALNIQDNNVQIYFGGYLSQESEDIFVHAESVHTIQKLQPILTKYQIGHSYHIDKQQNPIPASDCVICIGGEYVNAVSKKYLNDFIGKSAFLDKPLAAGHSVIVKMTPSGSKNTSPKSVFLLIGDTGRDTKSAVSYFAQHFSRLVKEKLQKPNMILFLKTQDEENSTPESPFAVVFDN